MKLIILFGLGLGLSQAAMASTPQTDGERVAHQLDVLQSDCNETALAQASRQLTTVDDFAKKNQGYSLNFRQRNFAVDILFGLARRGCIAKELKAQFKDSTPKETEFILVESLSNNGNTSLMRLMAESLHWNSKHVYLTRSLDDHGNYVKYLRSIVADVKAGQILILDNFNFFYQNVMPKTVSIFRDLKAYLPKGVKVLVINDASPITTDEIDDSYIAFRANGHTTLQAQQACRDTLIN